jgi:hypothetical protein
MHFTLLFLKLVSEICMKYDVDFEKNRENVVLTDVAMLTLPASLAKTHAAAGIRGPVART